jgi:hypothetical protein
VDDRFEVAKGHLCLEAIVVRGALSLRLPPSVLIVEVGVPHANEHRLDDSEVHHPLFGLQTTDAHLRPELDRSFIRRVVRAVGQSAVRVNPNEDPIFGCPDDEVSRMLPVEVRERGFRDRPNL